MNEELKRTIYDASGNTREVFVIPGDWFAEMDEDERWLKVRRPGSIMVSWIRERDVDVFLDARGARRFVVSAAHWDLLNKDPIANGEKIVWTIKDSLGQVVETYEVPKSWVVGMDGDRLVVQPHNSLDFTQVSIPMSEVSFVGPPSLAATAKWIDVDDRIDESQWKAFANGAMPGEDESRLKKLVNDLEKTKKEETWRDRPPLI
jgi:hypothetical protein